MGAKFGHKYDVTCEGEVVDSFSSAAGALIFAQWSAEITGADHEIRDTHTRTALLVVDCPEAA
jgi:hypothetical protein